MSHSHLAWSRVLPCVAAVLTLIACSSGTPSPRVASASAATCAPLPSAAETPESLVVILPPAARQDGFTSHPALPRFIEAQAYETLVRIDCDDSLVPALARSWRRDGSDRVRLELRRDAHFSSGDSLTTRAVVDSWRTTAATLLDPLGASDAQTLLAQTTIVDDHTLSVPAALLRTLADPALAIRRLTSASGVAEGSGRYRIVRTPQQQRTTVLEPVTQGPTTPRIIVRETSELDARDWLDAGADLVFTSDRTTLSYASARPDLVSVPLMWDRTYLLIIPRARSSTDQSSASAAAITLRESLARDAVRVDARDASRPLSWGGTDTCTYGKPKWYVSDTDPLPPLERIAYRADDPVARQLAERLVALASMRGPSGTSPLTDLAPQLARSHSLRAEPLALDALAGATTREEQRAYVIAVPSRRATQCDYTLNATATTVPMVKDAAIVPLIDIRSHAIVRRNRVSLVVDREGIPRIGIAPEP
jgi:hypothetical protein